MIVQTLNTRNCKVDVWNSCGELVTSFEDHLLWHVDCNTNNTFVTSDLDLIFSYCKTDPISEGNAGSINVSNISTGKCLTKIRADNYSCVDNGCISSRPSHAEASEGSTALFYDEERNEIYTGNSHGLVHTWSNQGLLARI